MTHGSAESVRRSKRRSRARADHFYVDGAGVRQPRAAFPDEPAASRAINRIRKLVGRGYAHFPCSYPGCDAWHIRPRRRRPESLARPA